MISLTLTLVLQATAMAAASNDYSTAYQQTAQTGRPLVVLIGADWCPGCREMKHNAIPTVQKQGGLDRVAFAYVNTDQQSDLAGKLMQGSSIPQLVVYQKTESGWKRQQLTGAHSPGDIQAFLEKVAGSTAPQLSSHQ